MVRAVLAPLGTQAGEPVSPHSLSEWRGGTSPSRSLRTVRDSLPSYGSHRPAWGADTVPVGEEGGLPLACGSQPFPGPGNVALESFELPQGPADEILVEPEGQEGQLGAIEAPVVVDPAVHVRVVLTGQAGQVQFTAQVEV